MDLLKILDDIDLPDEINEDAAMLEINKITEPELEPFPNRGHQRLNLGELPEDLKALKRLIFWYSYEIKSAHGGIKISMKKAIVEAIYVYLFSIKYEDKIKKGYAAAIFKNWQLIAYPNHLISKRDLA